jgi:hypothetical protein
MASNFLLQLKPVYYEDPRTCDKPGCGKDAVVRYIKRRRNLCLSHYRADKTAPHRDEVRRIGYI